MLKIDLDIAPLTRRVTEIEKRHLPRVLVQTVDATAFQVRDRWKTRITDVFDRPVPLTRNAVLYTRATLETLAAEVFIRTSEQMPKGNPPAKYLQPQEEGGARRQKGFERRLGAHPAARKFYVPGKALELDAFGNVPSGVYNKIFSQLGVAEDRAGFSANQTLASHKRRLARQRKRGGGGSYFILAQRRGKLRPGVIYERIADLEISDEGEARATSKVHAVLYPVKRAPVYNRRLNAKAIALQIARARYPKNFRYFMNRAIVLSRR